MYYLLDLKLQVPQDAKNKLVQIGSGNAAKAASGQTTEINAKSTKPAKADYPEVKVTLASFKAMLDEAKAKKDHEKVTEFYAFTFK